MVQTPESAMLEKTGMARCLEMRSCLMFPDTGVAADRSVSGMDSLSKMSGIMSNTNGT